MPHVERRTALASLVLESTEKTLEVFYIDAV